MATQTQDEVLSASHIPSHVAIIMDGNGRWAKQRGLPRTEGHIRGQDALRTTLRAAARRGIKYLTVYTFSTENWSPPQLIAEGVRMRAIGDLSRLPQQAQDSLAESIELTKDGAQITLILALSYSSRDEIRRASQRLACEAAAGRLRPEEITEELISSYLDTAEYPDPDLVIRTGGEERISNYLLWQSAYSELYFSETYWPDFGQEALDEALAAYASRERRFGKTSEQIQLED